MPTAGDDQDGEDVINQFLERRGHTTDQWKINRNRKQCPDCGAINRLSVVECVSCGWKQESPNP